MRRPMPENWLDMTPAEQHSWALTEWLRETLDDDRIVATFGNNGEFSVFYHDVGMDEVRIKKMVEQWFMLAYGNDVRGTQFDETTDADEDKYNELIENNRPRYH